MLDRHFKYFLSLLLVLGWTNQSLLAFQQESSQHIVKEGETLYSISKRYSQTPAEIRSQNNLADNLIFVGQKLFIIEEKEEHTQVAQAPYIDTLQQELDRLNEMYSAAFKPTSYFELTSIDFDSLFQNAPVSNTLNTSINSVLKEQMNQLRHDLGLRSHLSFTQNLEPGILNDEERFFDSRLSTGLSWELLKEGWLGNRIKANSLEKKQQFNELEAPDAHRGLQYNFWYNYLIYSFNQARINQIEEGVDLISAHLKVAAQLYYLRSISWEDILDLKSELATKQSNLPMLKAFNRAFEKQYDLEGVKILDIHSLPILSIDFEKLLAIERADSLSREMLAVERERLGLEDHWTSRISLKADVRYNMLNGGNALNARSYGSVGFTLSAPLFKNHQRAALQDARLDLLSDSRAQEKQGNTHELYRIYYEYAYAFKQYKDFNSKYQSSLQHITDLENRQLLWSNEHSKIQVLNLKNQLIAINYELLNIKQKLYLGLLKMYTLSKASHIHDFTKYPQPAVPAQSTKRGVYIWSKSLKQLPNEIILQYLNKNSLNRLFVSAQSYETEFLKAANQSQIEIIKLIGENSYARKGMTAHLREQLLNLDSRYQGVQLDVEPHTFPDWEDHERKYLQNILKVCSEAKSILEPDKELSVAIPFHYPKEFLHQLARIADELVIMAYGTTNIQKLQARLKEEINLQKVSISLVLRASDFDNRIQMEAFAQQALATTGIESLVFHDLDGLITLDQKTILGDQSISK